MSIKNIGGYMFDGELKQSTKMIFFGVLAVTLLGGVFILWQQMGGTAVNNFEECVAAGNPVMESFPEQCSHEGKTYVNT